MKTIGIVGGTGLIGSYLVKVLQDKGYAIVILSRNASKFHSKKNLTYVPFDPVKKICDGAALKKIDAVVHLSGAAILDKRWTKNRREEIQHARIESINFTIAQLKAFAPNCKIFLGTSSIGYYGPDAEGKTPFKENSPVFDDWVGNVVKNWEQAIRHAAPKMRTLILRHGAIFAKEDGAFQQFVRLMDLEIMPILGYSNQLISWIEASDLARMILFVLENCKDDEIINAVSPLPVAQKELARVVSSIRGGIRTPAQVPSNLIKIHLGEMATEVLKSCHASADKIMKLGFRYNYPDINGAVNAIFNK